MVAPAGPVRGQRLGDGLRPEQALSSQPVGGEQVVGPLPQRPSEPLGQGRVETRSWGAPRAPARHVAAEHLTDQPLPLAVAHLGSLRHPPRELDEPVVEERDAHLERNRHAGAVHLDEHVVGQGALLVGQQHPGQGRGAREKGLRPHRRRWRVRHHHRGVPLGGEHVTYAPSGSFADRACGQLVRLGPERRGRARDQAGPQAVPAGRAGRGEDSGRAPPKWSWQREQPGHPPLRDPVAVVPAEQFVGAVPAEADGHVLPGRRAQEGGGDAGRVGERLVIEGGGPPRQVEGIELLQRQGGVLGAQVARHRGGRGGLVVRAADSDGEGPHRPGAHALRHGDDGGRVDTPGEEGADRDVRLEPAVHGLTQDAVRHGHQLPVGQRQRVREARSGDLAQRPVGPGRGHGGWVGHSHDATGWEGADAREDGARRRDEPEAEVVGKRLRIRRPRHTGQPLDGRQLRGEREGVAHSAVVEGLLPHPVPGQDQLAVPSVPGGQGEHPVHGRDRGLGPGPGDQLEEDLGVGVAAQLHAP